MKWLGLAMFVVSSLVGCGTSSHSVGEVCATTSECGAPLVCRLERCRVECRGSRDCGAGLQCILDERGLGSCLVEDEVDCASHTDCPGDTMCASSVCGNECVADRDCPEGAFCDSLGDSPICREDDRELCVYDSECMLPLVCRAGQCGPECIDDRDCPLGAVCVESGPEGYGACEEADAG